MVIVLTPEQRQQVESLRKQGQTITYSIESVLPELRNKSWRVNDSPFYPWLGAVDVYQGKGDTDNGQES